MKKTAMIWVFATLLTLAGVTRVQAASEVDSVVRLLTERLTTAGEGKVIRVGETGLLFLQFDRQGGLAEGGQVELKRTGAPIRVGNETVGYEEETVGMATITKLMKDKALAQMAGNAKGVAKPGDKVYAAGDQKGRLVVTPFTYNNHPTEFSINLQEKLITSLVNKGIKVVERGQLEKVLKEQQLSYSGLVDLSSAQQIGKLLGAGGIVLGTITDQGNAVAVNSRLVEVGTADIVAAAEAELAKTPLVAQGLEKIATESGVTGGSSKSGAGTGKKVDKNSLFFENDAVRIEVVSFVQQPEGLLLKLRYWNRTKLDYELGLADPGENTYLVDNEGNQYSFKEAEMDRRRNLPVGAPRISDILFRNGGLSGKEFIFTAKYFPGGGIRDFSVSIAGLKPQ
ncbi:MAG: FlgO family outer membrane protein [Candidatus Contendobacter sp.]|nr:FlgO family outer membrane protein [Candidatus Contendobacter sp.]MDG4559109.1 FlgO family outer membrane protein [Candidatus Contendobacter sp.]